jgi:hypothetical protein
MLQAITGPRTYCRWFWVDTNNRKGPPRSWPVISVTGLYLGRKGPRICAETVWLRLQGRGCHIFIHILHLRRAPNIFARATDTFWTHTHVYKLKCFVTYFTHSLKQTNKQTNSVALSPRGNYTDIFHSSLENTFHPSSHPVEHLLNPGTQSFTWTFSVAGVLRRSALINILLFPEEHSLLIALYSIS